MPDDIVLDDQPTAPEPTNDNDNDGHHMKTKEAISCSNLINKSLLSHTQPYNDLDLTSTSAYHADTTTTTTHIHTIPHNTTKPETDAPHPSSQKSTPSDVNNTPSTTTSNTASTTTTNKHMILDAISLSNLEILKNNYDHTAKGSLWSFVNHCHTAFGSRILCDWLTHPLYNTKHIYNRMYAIEELLTTHSKQSEQIRNVFKKLPDIERLLLRVHSNGLKKSGSGANTGSGKGHNSDHFNEHPDNRAIMYEETTYSSRKIKDFIDILGGLESLLSIQTIFNTSTNITTNTSTNINNTTKPSKHNSILLQKIVQDKLPVGESHSSLHKGGDKGSELGRFPFTGTIVMYMYISIYQCILCMWY